MPLKLTLIDRILDTARRDPHNRIETMEGFMQPFDIGLDHRRPSVHHIPDLPWPIANLLQHTQL